MPPPTLNSEEPRYFILVWSGVVDPADKFGSELLTHVITHEFEGTDIVQNHPL